MSSFFHMPRGDLAYLAVVLGVAVVSFLPWARHVELAGMALVGWLMAGLMVVAPLIALFRIVAAHRRAAAKPSRDGEAPR